MTASRAVPLVGTQFDLVAKTVEVESTELIDLISIAGADGFLYEQEGHGLAGCGVAARIELPRGLHDIERVRDVVDLLSSIRGADATGTGPIAIGSFPFDNREPASMVVPAMVVSRAADGRQWVTTVGEGAAPDPRRGILDRGMAPAPPVTLPDGFQLTSPRSHPEWEDTIDAAVGAIAGGHLEKVVVAREVVVEANRPIVIPDVLERLRALYPSCVVFSIDGFVGASPELLVERRGRNVRCRPLAGTYPRSGDPHADEQLAAELLASIKDQREHRFVIDDMVDILEPLCSSILRPDGPSIMQLRNVLHLGTEIEGVLKEPCASALELASLLHPTPAVGGTPTREALAWIAENEGLARGHYAGPVGWVDRHGDGHFAVGIRSAEINGRRARLFAGVGIVEGSEPRRELIETQLKLQALLAAVVRP